MAYVKVKGTVVSTAPQTRMMDVVMVRLDAVPLILRTEAAVNLKAGDKVEVELSNCINVPAWHVKKVDG